MAEQLKNHFGVDVPVTIAGMIATVFPRFPAEDFIRDCLDGYASLELFPRGRKIARAMKRHLPEDYREAAGILIESLGLKRDKAEDSGMAPFLYLPHIFFVAEFGLDHFEDSMRAQYELTQRFSAEFSIRPYLERYPHATLARLEKWTGDSSVHVRRLVSEGTRPRLPWAPRLRAFQIDPRPVLTLLEKLKDDPELYVRRSVANNLNDIGKDHPAVLVDVSRQWLKHAPKERRWLIGHALRSAVKRGEAEALEVLGFGKTASVIVRKVRIVPKRASIGKFVTISFEVTNTSVRRQSVLVDFRIHFRKAYGGASPKVFKMKTLELDGNGSELLSKSISLAEMTTRKHYPGKHAVDIQLNGRVTPLGTFELARA
ncbi:MAG: DNA alkylation repair protein [Nitrospira sp.]|nr:MAG: DNA alkylation repair protein [Nitrospira sp.]